MSLINKKHVKDAALAEAKLQGRIQFSRVSKDFLERVDRRVERIIRSEIQTHPSRGITLK